MQRTMTYKMQFRGYSREVKTEMLRQRERERGATFSAGYRFKQYRSEFSFKPSGSMFSFRSSRSEINSGQSESELRIAESEPENRKSETEISGQRSNQFNFARDYSRSRSVKCTTAVNSFGI